MCISSCPWVSGTAICMLDNVATQHRNPESKMGLSMRSYTSSTRKHNTGLTPKQENFWDNLHRIPETQNHISNCEWQMTVVKRNYICQQGTNINWIWCNHFYSTFHNLIFNFAFVFSAVFCVIRFIYPEWAIVTIHSQPLGQLLILLTPRLSLSSWQLTLLLFSPF